MPTAAPTPCRHRGCPALTYNGERFCPDHLQAARRQHDRRRGSAASRGYDADWRRLRLAKLAADPLCECEDCRAGELRVTLATVVNHREEIENRPELRLEWGNLQSMSEECHNRHTGKTRGFGRARRG